MGQQLSTLNGLRWSGEDLQKKFADSFVRATVVSKGKKISDNGLVYITNPCVYEDLDNPSKMSVEGRAFLAHNNWTSFIVPHKDFFLEEDRPQPCISNCVYRYVDEDVGRMVEGHSAFMFSYNPARQWKRGFNQSNSYLFCPIQKGGDWGNLQVEAKYALNVLTPIHQPLSVSLEEMKKDKNIRARAISNRYWIIRQGEAIALYSKKAPLGNFVGERLFVGDGARLLRHEIAKELPEVRMNYG